MKKQILLMGKKGEYSVAKKSSSGLNLEPSSEKVFARELMPYGFDFTFGSTFEDISYGIMGYTHTFYRDKGKDGKYPESNEDYGRVNMDLTINGLEKNVEEAGADYILVDGLYSRDNHTSWAISGRAQLLLKR